MKKIYPVFNGITIMEMTSGSQNYCLVLSVLLIFSACQAVKTVNTTKNTGQLANKFAYKRTALSAEEEKIWPLMNLAPDSIPGISLVKACEQIESKQGSPVIVAIMDSGIDIDHEALRNHVWSNVDEIPANGKDDDGNGYIDDATGWNFLEDVYFAPMVVTRLIAGMDDDYKGKNVNEIPSEDRERFDLYQSLRVLYDNMRDRITANLAKKPVRYDPEAPAPYVERKRKYFEYLEARKDYHYNTTNDPRENMRDDLEDINDTNYGDSNVRPKHETETHGTHVAGIFTSIINKLPVSNIKFMPIRTTPNGDEYDKDVALGIRYAVDNGATVINMSFGKPYAEHPDWVYDAIRYAAEHDVLMIHAAGNDAINIDSVMNYPNDHRGTSTEIADNFISVGAITRYFNEFIVSSFSNYGARNVDIFAPGTDMYSSLPGSKYAFQNGTSMAAPMVTGVAALIRSYYPELSASKVKKIILESGIEVDFDVWLEREDKVLRKFPFKNICKSGRILNAHYALKMAESTHNDQSSAN